ncbi:methyltransferase [Prauserella cavernicola]|uniref:Methyltransferase n=1 Tax=Prauserella cavernicola TaxID=2800127 RepID=A0A934QQR4_9PSEU|nr:methyltransferase [Prauserella cavernicola]MBK1783689.1 methyltransferase [Prauserella cavernicola]
MSDEATGEELLRLRRQVFGMMSTQVISVALRLDLVEAIGDGTRSPGELAEPAGIPEENLLRLLRALAGLGVCAESGDGFSLTPAGRHLLRDHPRSVHALARMFSDPVMLAGWRHLEQSLRTGETSFETEFGTSFFDHLADSPELSALFNASMSQGTRVVAGALPSAYDFGNFHTIVDVGGGDGTLLSAVLQAHPAPRGVVFDTEPGAREAAANLERQGLTDRVSIELGDFFEGVPAGADAYLLKSIIHDWDDERAATILRHCRTALGAGGRVLIVEPVLPELVPPGSVEGFYLSDLNMLVNVGGRERTRADFEHLCGSAGLSLLAVHELHGGTGFQLLEATQS